MSLRARQDAQAACAADPATRLAQALERMAEALADAGRRQAQEDAAAIRRTVELAAAIARAAAPADRPPSALADRIGEMLAGLDGPAAARLVVAPLPWRNCARCCPSSPPAPGFAGSLELEADPRLPEGAAQLLWPGGWLEHDPGDVAAASPSSWPPTSAAPRPHANRWKPTMSTTQPDLPATFAEPDAGTPASQPSIEQLSAVYDIPVQLSAVLGKTTMPVSQLLRLGRGAVVELDRKVGEPVEIYVNNRLVARGEVLVVDDHLGITMTEIVKGD